MRDYRSSFLEERPKCDPREQKRTFPMRVLALRTLRWSARPKSISLTQCCPVCSIIFSGFRSRCRYPASCRSLKAATICPAIIATVPSENFLPLYKKTSSRFLSSRSMTMNEFSFNFLKAYTRGKCGSGASSARMVNSFSTSTVFYVVWRVLFRGIFQS